MQLGDVSFSRDHGFQNVLSLPLDFDGDFQLWRYLSLPKFLKLLDDNYLYLALLSNFDDPFEGSLPKTHPDAVKDFQEKNNMTEGAVKGYDYYLKKVKEHVYINCWHINDYESAAMWSLYSKTNESIAIQSTFLNLQRLVSNQAQMGAVAYIDYKTDFIPQGNMNYHCLCKRKSFTHEKEFRIIEYDMTNHFNDEKGDDFKTVDLDLSELIENIFISPGAPEYLPDLISSISSKYGYEFEINNSTIDSDPFY